MARARGSRVLQAVMVTAALWRAAPRDALAQPAPVADKAAKPAPAPAPAQLVRREPAVASVAKDLVAALGALSGPALVAVAPLESDAKATRPDDLAVLVASQLAGQGGFEAPKAPEPVTSAIARADGAKWVVYLRVRVEAGRLRAAADVHPVPASVWARARNPSPGPVRHAFAEAAIDAEVRSHLAPVPLVAALEFSRGKNFELGVLALACDDLDRDGAPELVTVSRSAVTVSRIRGGKVAPVTSRPWSELSKMDPTPLREPIAAVFTLPPLARGEPAPLELVASLTDRSHAVRLGASLEPVATYPGFAIPEGGSLACARFPALTLTGPLDPCGPADPPPRRASVTGRFDAFAAATLVSSGGSPFEVWAGREDGVVEVRDDRGATSKIASGGAQLAVGDLDQDGLPEILTSLDVERGGPDALVIYSWDRSEKPPKEQLRIPIAAGVHALAVCPPVGPGRTPIVLATGDELVVAQ